MGVSAFVPTLLVYIVFNIVLKNLKVMFQCIIVFENDFERNSISISLSINLKIWHVKNPASIKKIFLLYNNSFNQK